MHEKILIPPAVHDEPHFAKKTLVLAVLLSATSMFATAASVNVVTGQTYLDDVDVKAPYTFTNAGTVKNQTITVAGSSKAAFHNTGIIETGTLTLDGIQGLEIGGKSITATKGIVVKGIPGVNSLRNLVTVGKIVTPELKLIGTVNEYGLLFNSTEQVKDIDRIYVECNNGRTGLLVETNKTVAFNEVELGGTGTKNEARIEVEAGATSSVEQLIASTTQAKVQVDGTGEIKIRNVAIKDGAKLGIQTWAPGKEENTTDVVTVELGSVVVGENASLVTQLYDKAQPGVTYVGAPTFTLEKGAMVDLSSASKDDGKPAKARLEAEAVTFVVEDASAATVYVPVPENVKDDTVMTVKGAAANNTGDAGADLKALSTIVKTAKTDTKGVAGVTLEQEASEIFDGATGVTDENGSITGVKVQANPATHGIAEMTALGLQIWRNEINDMNKRLGELRDSADDANGVWARVYTGKAKYGNLGVTNKYTSFQFGYDRQVVPGMWLGGAISYTDGNNDFANGDGDSETYAFTGYGSWLADNGMFVDVTGKVGRLKNSFDISTTLGTASGSYNTNAFSLSAEAGWRLHPLANSLYVEPQVEMMYGRVLDADYTTSMGVAVEHEAVDTLIGRVGFVLGLKCPNNRGNTYVRASILHDWQGDAESTFTKGGQTKRISEELGDTWLEYGVGANFNATKNLHLYADLEATEGAKVETSYRFNLGARWSF